MIVFFWSYFQLSIAIFLFAEANKKDFHFNLGYKSHKIGIFVTELRSQKTKSLKTKNYLSLLILLLTVSCQVTETLYINADGSGTIKTIAVRDEQSYMQLVGENYAKEEKFVDTTYVFSDYIKQYADNFSKLPTAEKEVYAKFKDVNVHIKKSSFDKEFRNTIWQDFKKVEHIADLEKTENYADNLKHNYALSAEEHYYTVSYTFDGTVFKRIVIVTDPVELKKRQDLISERKSQLSKFKIAQSYTLSYHFPKKIKSVSNPNATISEDKKSVKLVFEIATVLQDPVSTTLEVVLE